MSTERTSVLAATAVSVSTAGRALAENGDGDDASTALQTGTAIGAVLMLALILVVLLRFLIKPR